MIEALYFLRRGPLLATPSPDGAEDAQRLILRHIFLRAAPEAALRMVVPRLLMFQPGRPPREVPPADLALRSDVALLLDLGTDLIIWTVGRPWLSSPLSRSRPQSLAHSLSLGPHMPSNSLSSSVTSHCLHAPTILVASVALCTLPPPYSSPLPLFNPPTLALLPSPRPCVPKGYGYFHTAQKACS